MSDWQPPDVFEFDDLATMDALENPIRLKLLDAFRRPATAKEAADALDVPVTRLYHHINQMLEHGLLLVVEERPKGAMTERVFGIGGKSIRPSAAFRERYGAEGQAEVVRLAFRMAETEMTSVVAEGLQDAPVVADVDPEARASIGLSALRLEPASLEALVADLNGLVARYSGEEGSIPVGFFHAVYPRGLSGG